MSGLETIMELNDLRKTELLRLCEELGVDVGKKHRKPEIIQAILATGADEAELSESWEEVKRAVEKETEQVEIEREKVEIKRQELELERRKIDIEEKRHNAGREGSEASSRDEKGII